MITYFNPPNNNFTAKDIQEYYCLAEYRYEQVEQLYSMIKNNIRNAVNTGYSNIHYNLKLFGDNTDTVEEIIERLKDDYFRVEQDDEYVTIYWD
uniref:Uncharacterized protein n=1 Tax=Siphoviridae sp. ctZHD14 TaxID=2827891 RepID=A0A8S5SWN7_9CAUD|nr:MAG TPA: hypothetical protein [Siphoviridae sp. ctZHD14]